MPNPSNQPGKSQKGRGTELTEIPTEIDSKLLNIINGETAREYKILPMMMDGKTLIVGAANNRDFKLMSDADFLLGAQRNKGISYRLVNVDPEKLNAATEIHYPEKHTTVAGSNEGLKI